MDSDVFDKYILTSAQRPEMFLSASSHERKSACQPKGWRTFYFLSAKLAKKINNHSFKC